MSNILSKFPWLVGVIFESNSLAKAREVSIFSGMLNFFFRNVDNFCSIEMSFRNIHLKNIVVLILISTMLIAKLNEIRTLIRINILSDKTALSQIGVNISLIPGVAP